MYRLRTVCPCVHDTNLTDSMGVGCTLLLPERLSICGHDRPEDSSKIHVLLDPVVRGRLLLQAEVYGFKSLSRVALLSLCVL